MLENRGEIKDINITRKFSLKFKIIAFVLIFAFVFQSMEEINSHTYKLGIDNNHYLYSFAGCFPVHLASNCKSSSSCHFH